MGVRQLVDFVLLSYNRHPLSNTAKLNIKHTSDSDAARTLLDHTSAGHAGCIGSAIRILRA
jgi:hypothetical protein